MHPRVVYQILASSLILGIAGSIILYVFRDLREAVWFGVGAFGAVMNIALGALLIQKAFKAKAGKIGFSFLVLLKSISFIGAITVALAFLKPAVLAFTGGLGIVIVGSVFWVMVGKRFVKTPAS